MSDVTRRAETFWILAPQARDAGLMVQALDRGGFAAQVLDDREALFGRLDAELPCGLVLGEDSLQAADWPRLTAQLGRQPPWSDMPILVLAQNPELSLFRLLLGTRLNVVLLEKPVRLSVLLTAAESALRSRWRQ